MNFPRRLVFAASLLLVACESTPSIFTNDASLDACDLGIDSGSRDGNADSAGDATDSRVPSARFFVDQPDDTPDNYQLHILYVEPADRVASPPLDQDGTLRRAISSFNGWLASRADGSKLRIDTFQGQPDITFVKLNVNENALAQGIGMTPTGTRHIHERLEALLMPAFNDAKKMYLVYYDGLAIGTCGDSPVPGHMPIVYVGGIWSSTFVVSEIIAGAMTASVHDPVETNLPAPPFAAHIGSESVQVIAVSGTQVTFASALAAPHPTGELLLPDQRPQDCRLNPYSRDGIEFTYATFVGLHEVVHALGMVDSRAPDQAAPPVAAAHLNASSPGGLNDLMYQGPVPSTCGNYAATPAQSPCVLDPGHRNYYRLPASSPLVDLAKSAFLDPSIAGALPPPGW